MVYSFSAVTQTLFAYESEEDNCLPKSCLNCIICGYIYLRVYLFGNGKY